MQQARDTPLLYNNPGLVKTDTQLLPASLFYRVTAKRAVGICCVPQDVAYAKCLGFGTIPATGPAKFAETVDTAVCLVMVAPPDRDAYLVKSQISFASRWKGPPPKYGGVIC